MNNYRAVTESDQIRPGIKLGKKSFQHFKRTFESSHINGNFLDFCLVNIIYEKFVVLICHQ